MSAPSFAGKTAIVTGGGSGIGASLTRALVAAGAHVVCADIDPEAAERTVAGVGGGPGSARAAAVDVTSAEQVQRLVDDVVAQHGRLDLMFNNAGITFFGDTHDLTLDQWDAIIDVNVRGVVHGVHAAYARMREQGSGHIVNTASMAGLMAAGLMTSYATTKHAVVGLSLALRSEACAYGVGVTVVCPAAVDTPILDKGDISRHRGRDFYTSGQGVKEPLDPDVLAARVLRAVAEDRAMVVEPRQARVAWRVGRLAPTFVQRMTARTVAKQLSGAAR